MKRLLVMIAAAGLLLIPSVVAAQDTGVAEAPPPVSQTLVREGDFAVDLAVALKLGEPGTEAEAEDMLVTVGITPKNGWISDYPVTPDVLGELMESVKKAASSDAIPLELADAEAAFRKTAADNGLEITPADADTYAGESGEFESGDYTSRRVDDYDGYYDRTVINNYYYDYGPPVVTYYSPPWDYWYLYSWVYYPFWYYGYYYPGYYILNDFRVTVNVGHRHHHHHRRWASRSAVVTNQVIDADTNTVSTVNPETRRLERRAAREGRIDRAERRAQRAERRAQRSDFTNSGRSILDRSERRRINREARRGSTGVSSTGDAASVERTRDRNRGGEWADRRSRGDSNVRGRSGDADRPRMLGHRERNVQERSRGISRDRTSDSVTSSDRPRRDRSFDRRSRTARSADRSFDRPRSIGSQNRSFDRRSRTERSADRSFDRPRSIGGQNRSFDRPSRTDRSADRSFDRPRSIGSQNRSFSRPSGNSAASGRSFNAPSRSSGNLGRSFNRPSGNRGGSGIGRGNRGGGGESRGCRGRNC